MKRFLKAVSAVVLTIALCGACSSADETKESVASPSAALSIIVEPLTEEEYSDINTDGLGETDAEDFSKVTVTVEMTNMIVGTERSVKMPALKNIMTDKQIDGYWHGKGHSQNNADKDFSEWVSENIIYRKDLTDDDIRNIFDGEEAVATYYSSDDEIEEKVIAMVDCIEFK